MQDQIQSIKRIMGDTNTKKEVVELSHFTVGEKIRAIYNWKRASNTNFSTSFIDSVYDQHLQNRRISLKQVAAVDNIIIKFNICMDTWS